MCETHVKKSIKKSHNFEWKMNDNIMKRKFKQYQRNKKLLVTLNNLIKKELPVTPNYLIQKDHDIC